MTYAPNHPNVNQMMAVFEKLLRQTNDAKEEMAVAVNSFVNIAQDIIATKIAEIAALRAQLAERDALIARVTKTLGGYSDSDLLSLATTVAIGYQQWSDGHDAITDNLREQVVDLRAQVATLTERLSRCTCTDDYGDVAE